MMNATEISNETLINQQNDASAHSWEAYQNALAEENGLAILLVDGAQPPALAVSYNNSICRMMQSSETHEHLCEPFCGKAFENAVNAGETIAYRCHAGLQCLAAPLKTDENLRPLVAIVGRAFVKTSDYRALTERVFEGDLQDLPAEELLQNILLTNSQNDLERLAVRLQSLGEEEEQALFELTSKLNTNLGQIEIETESEKAVEAENIVDEKPQTAQILENSPIEPNAVQIAEHPQIENQTATENKPQIVDKIEDNFYEESDDDFLSEVTRTLPDPRQIGRALESFSDALRGSKSPQVGEIETQSESNENVKSIDDVDFIETKSLSEIAAKTESNLSEIESTKIETSNDLQIGDDVSTAEDEFATESDVEDIVDDSQTLTIATNNAPTNFAEIGDDLAAWQNFTGSLMRQSFREANVKTLQFLAGRFHLTDLAWLEKWENWLQATLATGRLQNEPMRIGLEVTDERLREAVRRETSVRLEKHLPDGKAQVIELFPLAISDEIKAAIVIGDSITNDETRVRISRFCRNVTLPLEVLRLREEIEKGSRAVSAVQIFSEKLTSDEIATSEDAFDYLTKVSAEILRAERSSLLVFDEDDNYLKAKSAFGVRSDIIKQQTATGERVANEVWNDGKTRLVKNVELSGLSPASPERGYNSNSFISFPIFVGTRKIGVLNVTDKIGGEDYDENDVRLLESIAPSFAIALDRALLQQKAGKFQVLSITDSLTGLLNRRYLEERLAEELKRSHRHGYPMSFMMIDVDNFKQYNDLYGHVAGDEALRITARCLKAALRGADVAARFGGEEFSILLPQTTISEANAIAERIRQRVETTTFANGKVTVSIGIAAFSQRFDTPQAFIKAADTALYEAKANGKNAVRLWKNTENPSINSF